MIYVVTDKATGQEVYRYQGDGPVEWTGMEFSTHDHVAEPVVNTDGSVDTPIIRTVWTRTAWKRRFKQDERLAIREASKQSDVLADYMDLMEGSDEIASDDPDVVAALGMLERVGLIETGRAQEILHG